MPSLTKNSTDVTISKLTIIYNFVKNAKNKNEIAIEAHKRSATQGGDYDDNDENNAEIQSMSIDSVGFGSDLDDIDIYAEGNKHVHSNQDVAPDVTQLTTNTSLQIEGAVAAFHDHDQLKPIGQIVRPTIATTPLGLGTGAGGLVMSDAMTRSSVQTDSSDDEINGRDTNQTGHF